MILAKIHSAEGRKIVAVCDSELLGKRFEEGEFQIDLTGGFYRGEEVSGKELDGIVKGAYLMDFVGEESTGIAMKKGIVEEEGIIKVKGIPHAQVFSMD